MVSTMDGAKCDDVNSATLWYLENSSLWETEKPYFINVPQSALRDGEQRTNEKSVPVSGIRIRNMKSANIPFSFELDTHGFTYTHHKFSGKEADFKDPAYLRETYAPEIQEWLLHYTGGEHAIVLTTSVRRRDPDFPVKIWGTSGAHQPIQGVHVDYTPNFGPERVGMFLSHEQRQTLPHRRLQILNVWRPLFGPVRDWPLAVCDSQTVNVRHDLIASDNILPHFVGETFNVIYSSKHEWWYIADQMPEDVLIFKSYDSKEGVPFACPHASFDLEMSGSQRRRESVEMIVAVIHPEKEV